MGHTQQLSVWLPCSASTQAEERPNHLVWWERGRAKATALGMKPGGGLRQPCLLRSYGLPCTFCCQSPSSSSSHPFVPLCCRPGTAVSSVWQVDTRSCLQKESPQGLSLACLHKGHAWEEPWGHLSMWKLSVTMAGIVSSQLPMGFGARDQCAFSNSRVVAFQARWEGSCPHCEGLLTSVFPSTQHWGSCLFTTLQQWGWGAYLRKAAHGAFCSTVWRGET